MKAKLILFLISSLLILTGCSTKKEPPPAPPKKVSIMQVSSKPLSEDYRLTGNVKPKLSLNLSSEVAGTIIGLPLEVGDSVKKGQVVATIEDKDYQLQLKAATAQVATLKAQLERAKIGPRQQEITAAEIQLNQAHLAFDKALDYKNRISALYETGAVAKQQLIQAETEAEQLGEKVKSAEVQLNLLQEGPIPEDLKALETQIEQAETNVALLKSQLEKTKITAPKSGVIVKKLSEVGEITSPGKPLLVISEMNPILIETLVPIDLAGHLTLEHEILIETEAGLKLTGKLTKKGPLADPATRKLPVEIQVTNKDYSLQPGMMVWVNISLPNPIEGILVPTKAVIGRSKEKVVYLYSQNAEIVKETRVEVGKVYDDYLEIIDGLQVGDWIVIDGAHYISDKEKVNVSTTGSDKS